MTPRPGETMTERCSDPECPVHMRKQGKVPTEEGTPNSPKVPVDLDGLPFTKGMKRKDLGSGHRGNRNPW